MAPTDCAERVQNTSLTTIECAVLLHTAAVAKRMKLFKHTMLQPGNRLIQKNVPPKVTDKCLFFCLSNEEITSQISFSPKCILFNY